MKIQSIFLIILLTLLVLTCSGCSSKSTGSPDISCEIVVTSPTSSSNWFVGEPRIITWITSGDCGSEVMIELYIGSLKTCTIESSTENDGTYGWTVSNCGNSGSNYRIKITNIETGVSSFSSYFSYNRR